MEKQFVIQDIDTKKYYVGQCWNDFMWSTNLSDAQKYNSKKSAESVVMTNPDKTGEFDDYTVKEAFEETTAVQVIPMFINYNKL